MFESLFNNAEEKSDRATSLQEDVQWILGHTNYVLLRAVWDEFLHLLRQDPKFDEDDERDNIEGQAEHSWYALKALENNGFNLSAFSIYEVHLLKALKDGYIVYDEILHVLIEHHNDTGEARFLFEMHPEIHKHLPREYDNPRQVLEVLVEIARVYRLELEAFGSKHGAAIDRAVLDIARGFVLSQKKK